MARFHKVLLLAAIVSVALSLSSACCKRSDAPTARDYRPARDEFSVMTYNLYRYGKHDRDNDGVEDDPKPADECDAVTAIIADVQPDILAVQEIGDEADFQDFLTALRMAGLHYEYTEFLAREGSRYNMALLSTRPILSTQSHTNDVYTIGDRTWHVLRGFIDVTIAVREDYHVRVLAAHLKSKRFSEAGQTEMRRNEARLLGKHVRTALKNDPDLNLIVVGDLNDTYNSAAVRAITGKERKQLIDTRLADYSGDRWTYFGAWSDQYDRIDYILASPGLYREFVPEKSRVVRYPGMLKASDHRPLVAVFKQHDR